MVKNNATPSPKPRNRLLQNLRLTMRANSQMTNLTGSLPEKPSNRRVNSDQIHQHEKDNLKLISLSKICEQQGLTETYSELKSTRNTHMSSHTGNDSDLTSPTSSGSASNSSNLSSPFSNITSDQPDHHQRRYASWFSKITYSTGQFTEDRYIYSNRSPGKMMSSQDLMTDPSIAENIQTTPFFAIPSTRQNLTSDLGWFFDEDQEEIITEDQISRLFSDDLSPNVSLRSAFQEVWDYDQLDNHTLPDIPKVTEDLTNSIYQFLNSLSTSLRRDQTEFSSSLANWNRDSVVESFDQVSQNNSNQVRDIQTFSSSELGRRDSPTLGYSSELPLALKCSLARTKKVSRRNKSNQIKSELSSDQSTKMDASNLNIPCDFRSLSFSLDSCSCNPSESSSENMIGIAL